MRIVTPLLLIEPFEERHLTAQYVGWLNDPHVVRFSDQRFRTHTLAGCREYWNSFASSPSYFWMIHRRDNDLAAAPIGTMTAHVDAHHGVADVGILIGDAAHWGQGYATEAWRAVCDYLLRRVGLRKVTGGTIEPNVGMLRVMEKAGMIDDGRRPRQALWDNREVDVIHKAAFRDPWLARHPRPLFAES